VARLVLAGALAALAGVLLVVEPPWRVPGGPSFFAREGEALVPVVKRALWWSALAAAAICAALFAGARLWTAPLSGPRAAPAPAPRWLGPALLAALLLGAGVRAPLAGSGLWWDEAWAVRRAIVGEHEPAPALDGPAPRFEAAPWARTLFAWEKPTNHLPQSIASRAALELWRAAVGAGPDRFDERVLRLPAVAAALLSIPLLGLLVADWGYPRAGVAAALLLALHPWHVEDATGARGYALVALAAIACALFLGRALSTAAWRWWLSFAAAEVLLLWTHPFAVYLAACFGAAALAQLAHAGRLREAPRLVAANAGAAALFLVLMGPGLAQVPLWHDVHRTREGDTREVGRVVSKLVRELWTRAAIGVPLSVPQTDPERTYPDLRVLRARSPVVRPVLFGALPALALLGLAAVLRRPGPQRSVALALLAAPPLAIAGSAALGHLGQRFHARYLFFALALVPPLLAVGVDTAASRLAGPRRAPRAAWAALALAVAGFAWLVFPATRNHAAHPYAGMREAVAFVAARPGAAAALRAGVGLGGDTARVYDPGLLHVEDAAGLRALLERARRDGRPLYVLYGYAGRNRHRHPDVFALLDERRLFEPLGRFDAIAPEFVYRVLRYTGAPPDDGALGRRAP